MVTIDDLKPFRRALLQVASVCKGNTMPMLECARLRYDGKGSMEISGTDLACWVTVSVSAAGDEPMELMVSARALAGFVGAAPDQKLKIRVEGERARFSVGRARASLATWPADDFPEPAADDESLREFEVDAAAFRDALNSVSYAAAVADVRRFLCGINIQPDPDGVLLVGADGHRLAYARLPCDVETWAGPRIIPSSATRRVIRSVLGEMEGSADVSLSTRVIRVSCGPWDVRVLLLSDTSYPDWRRAMDAVDYHPYVIVSRDALRGALKRAEALLDAKAGLAGVLVEVDAKGVTLSLSGAGDKAGYRETVDAAVPEGVAVTTGYSLAYLKDALESMDPGDLHALFGARGDHSELRLRMADSEQRECLVMPMRM